MVPLRRLRAHVLFLGLGVCGKGPEASSRSLRCGSSSTTPPTMSTVAGWSHDWCSDFELFFQFDEVLVRLTIVSFGDLVVGPACSRSFSGVDRTEGYVHVLLGLIDRPLLPVFVFRLMLGFVGRCPLSLTDRSAASTPWCIGMGSYRVQLSALVRHGGRFVLAVSRMARALGDGPAWSSASPASSAVSVRPSSVTADRAGLRGLGSGQCFEDLHRY